MARPGPRPRSAARVPGVGSFVVVRGDQEALHDPHELHFTLAPAEDVQPGGGIGACRLFRIPQAIPQQACRSTVAWLALELGQPHFNPKQLAVLRGDTRPSATAAGPASAGPRALSSGG